MSTVNWLTKYERTKMLGLRMEQLARGAPALVDVVPGMSVRDVALRELEERKLPFKVIRTLPNGEKETWRAADLE